MHPLRRIGVVVLCAGSAWAQPTSTGPLAPPANGPRRGDATWTALYDCTVHTDPTASLAHATVVFRDGLITQVLSAERTDEAHAVDHDAQGPIRPGTPPPGARLINCTGLHLYAGLIDAYVEVDAPPPAGDASTKHWSPKVTPQRSALDGAGVDDRTAEALRKLGFTAAAIAPRGGVFRGSAAVVSLAKPSEEQSAARPPVYAEGVYQSVAFELGGGYPGSEMGAVAMIRQTLIDADWQEAAREAGQTVEGNCLDVLGMGTSSLREASESASFSENTATTAAGMDPRPNSPFPARGAHTPLSERGATQPPLLFNTDDSLEPLRAIKIADEFHRPYVLLGSGSEYQRLGALKEALAHSAPGLGQTPMVVLPLNFPKAPDVSSIGKAEAVDLKELMTWEQAPTNPRRLAAAGVEFALTTAKARDRGDFRRNLQSALKHGLTEGQALAALTTTPARLLNIAGTCGTIDRGKRANLVLADGPIFGDKTKLRSVYIDGLAHEITPPPVELEGRWDVAVAAGVEGAAPAGQDGKPAEERYLTIDKDNGLSVHLGDKSIKATRVVIEKERVSFAFDHEPLDGQKGIFIASAIVEGGAGGGAGLATGGGSAAAATLSGTCLRADGTSFAFTATRRAPSPLAGTWQVTNADDKVMDAKAKEGLTITISESAVTLTFTKDKPKGKAGEKAEEVDKAGGDKPDMPPEGADQRPDADKAPIQKSDEERADNATDADRDRTADASPGEKQDKAGDEPEGRRRPRAGGRDNADTVIKCDKVVMKGDTVTFTHSLAKIGGGKDDTSTDSITLSPNGPGREDDVINGESTLSDGTHHTYRAVRLPHEGTEVAPGLWLSEDEAERIKAIPEKLPTPFHAYGVEERPPLDNVLFTRATIWTDAEAGIINNGVVHIVEGKIAFVGTRDAWEERAARVRMRQMPREVDALGKHITPGIIDCHSHTGISRGVNEGGQAVTAEVRVGDVTDPDDVDWYRQLAGGVTAVNSLHGSANAIGGQSQTNKLRWGCAHPDDMHVAGAMPGIKFALGENPRQVNFGGGGRGGAAARYPTTRMGVEQIIRDRFTAAKEYMGEHPDDLAAKRERLEKLETSLKMLQNTSHPISREARAAQAQISELKSQIEAAPPSSATALPRRDLELEALAEVLAGKRLVHCHSYRQDEIVMLFNVAKDFNFRIGTMQHALEVYKVADMALQYTGGASGFADWWAYKIEVQDAIPAAFPIMHDVGLLVSYNSDSDELARRLNVDAAKAVKYGNISPEEALKFVTLNPAKQLRVDDHMGSLEVGKDADLVVWSGDPLSAFSKAEMTYVDGRCLFSLEQDTKNRERIKGERQRLIQKLLSEGASRREGRGDDARPDGPRPEGGPGGPRGRRRPPNE